METEKIHCILTGELRDVLEEEIIAALFIEYPSRSGYFGCIWSQNYSIYQESLICV